MSLMHHYDKFQGHIMKPSIFATPSLRLLDADQQAQVRAFDREEAKVNQYWDYFEIHCNREFLGTTVSFYTKLVQETNPAILYYLSEHKKEAIREQLQFAIYLFCAQYELNWAEDRKQLLDDLEENIQTCACLLDRLNNPLLKELNPENQLHAAIQQHENCLKYVGFSVGQFIADIMADFHSLKEEFNKSKTQFIKDIMGKVNSKRLYWVWGGGLISTIISLLPNNFDGKSQGLNAAAAPAPVTGRMSWMLYYARFAINLSLLMKHTIAGPWMRAEEEQIPTWERFKTQWKQRKFSLLNDSIWATCNLSCFFWLTGTEILSNFGNLFTGLLLLMDVCLTAWRFVEESTKYNKERLQLDEDIIALRNKLQEENDEMQQGILQEHLDSLVKQRAELVFEWKYKKYATLNDLAYAVALFSSFNILACGYIPSSLGLLAPTTILMMGLIGAALCFVFTVIAAVIAGYLEIAKLDESIAKLTTEQEKLLDDFIETDDQNLQLIFALEYQRLEVLSKYTQEQTQYQMMVLFRDTFIQVIIPTVFMATFVFLPLSIAIGVMVVAIIGVLLTQFLSDRFKPMEPAYEEPTAGKSEIISKFRNNFFPPAKIVPHYGSDSDSDSDAGPLILDETLDSSFSSASSSA
jgi:hypothetical protein